jgi:hypothetical protein
MQTAYIVAGYSTVTALWVRPLQSRQRFADDCGPEVAVRHKVLPVCNGRCATLGSRPYFDEEGGHAQSQTDLCVPPELQLTEEEHITMRLRRFHIAIAVVVAFSDERPSLQRNYFDGF